jgi:hypothetical protein
MPLEAKRMQLAKLMQLEAKLMQLAPCALAIYVWCTVSPTLVGDLLLLADRLASRLL